VTCVHEEHEENQYTFVGKKGQQRMEQMAEIQRCNFSWLLDQCPMDPHQWLAEIDTWRLPPHNGMRLSGKASTVLAERNKGTSCTSGKKSGKDPNQNDVRIVDRSYLQKNFKGSVRNSSKIDLDVVENLNYLWSKKGIQNYRKSRSCPGSEQLIMM